MPPKLPFRTALHSLLPSLRVPIVSGPMGGAAGGKLAAHVTRAGGFGFIGGGYFTPDQIRKEFDQVGEILGANGSSRVEVGMGFLAWKLTELDGGIATSSLDDVNSRPKAYACIDTALRCRPRAIWLAFGADRELVQWAQAIKKREREIHQVTDTTEEMEPSVLFMGVGSVKEAEAAIEADADVIVAQGQFGDPTSALDAYFKAQLIESYIDFWSILGIEAGGHGSSTSPPLSNLLPAIVDLLKTRSPNSTRPTKPCVIGAGGLSSGSHLLSTLSLGAAGAVYGTRFLLTPESSYPRGRKDLLLAAKTGDTTRSMAFDEARKTLSWPGGVDGRGLKNLTVKEYEIGLGSREIRQSRYSRAELERDPERLIVWAGTGVGEMNEMMPAGEVVRELEREAVEAWERLRGLEQ